MADRLEKQKAAARRWNRKKKDWRRLEWSAAGKYRRFLLRRALCFLLAAEAGIFALEYGNAGTKLAGRIIHREDIYERQDDRTEPERKKEWGFSVDLKEGVLKFWRIKEITEPEKP